MLAMRPPPLPPECTQARTAADLERVTRRLLWRRLPSQLWSKVFHVSPIQVAFCITAMQLWLVPPVLRAWPPAAQVLGAKLAFAVSDATTDAERSEAIAMTVLSVCSVLSAFMAIVRTYSDLDVAFAAAGRIMSMVDAMDACERMNTKHSARAAGALRRGAQRGVVMDSVTFAAPNGAVLARDVSLRLRPGQRLLVTGPR